MIPLIVGLFAFSLLVMGGGIAFYVLRRSRAAKAGAAPAPPPTLAPPPPRPTPAAQPRATRTPARFRWRYILLPVVLLVASIATVAFFYRLLPDQVGWHFAADGAADKFVARGTLLAIMLAPQFVLALFAAATALAITRVGTLMKAGPTPASTGGIITIMGNMLALPQAILLFAMLDIFLYNAYQTHLLKLWVFAVLAMLAGGVLLGTFFARALRQARSTAK